MRKIEIFGNFIANVLIVACYMMGLAYMLFGAMGGLFFHKWEPATYDLLLGYILYKIFGKLFEKFKHSKCKINITKWQTSEDQEAV